MKPGQHPARLTAADRDAISRAYQLADLTGADDILEHADVTDPGMAYASAFGEAQNLLRILAAIAEQQDTAIGNMPSRQAEGDAS